MGDTIRDGRGEGNEAGVNDSNELLTANTPQITYYDNVALGNVPGVEFRLVVGFNTIGEGVANESVLAEGFTGRYPFPSAAAQMDIVSTSNDDNITGTGLRMLLVRGLLADGTELFEAVVLNGTSSVTTTNSYFRVNSIIGTSAGSGGKNAGIITLKNGSNLLSHMPVGDNLSSTAIYTIPTGVTGLVISSNIITAKDDSGVAITHLFSSLLGGLDLSALKQETYQNQIRVGDKGRFTLTEGSSVEITGYGLTGTGNAHITGQFELILVDNV